MKESEDTSPIDLTKKLEFVPITEAEHAFYRKSGLYKDWIEGGKTVPFEEFKEQQRLKFVKEYNSKLEE